MKYLAILVLILPALQAESKIILPMTPVLTEPNQPAPVIDVSVSKPISQLVIGEWYVIESDIELIVLQSPDKLLTIDVSTGPVKAMGKFCDGNGKVESREYKRAFVYFVSSENPGKTELILIPVAVATQADIVRQVLTVSGVGPQPPPDILVPTPVIVVPSPVIVPSKLQFVIIEDPSERANITASQIAIMDGAELRDYCKTLCTITVGTQDKRVLSVRQDISGQPEWVKQAFAEPRTSVPLLVILTPTKKISGPLPKTIEETMTEIKKYGGE